MAELDGKVAIITGGASGIGEASARTFVAEGARVVIADMQRARGEALAAELGEAARFQFVEVRQEDHVRSAVALAVESWGRLDCMFNNAGFGGALGPIEDTPVEEFDMTMDVLVRGVFLGMKHAIPIMKRQGSGSIINTGSIAAIAAGRGPIVYSAAKAAVVHLSKAGAMQLGADNIRVNAICPGYIATPLSANTVGKPDSLIDERVDDYASRQPLPRVGRAQDIAEMALYLASDRSSFVTGQALVVDGGVTAGVNWADQRPGYKVHRPIRVYNPDAAGDA
ncbi:MAG: SDR family oxidoreductase [Chromatiales bacterium]|jgi:NAD(P)-dependent dehydrogenase (short-subunit alcohol dehydrogenase family)|nr:SDR family oxidoreductase [Chromatiales bacterium]